MAWRLERRAKKWNHRVFETRRDHEKTGPAGDPYLLPAGLARAAFRLSCSLAVAAAILTGAAAAGQLKPALLSEDDGTRLQARLQSLQASGAGAGPLAGAAISVRVDDKLVWSGGAGCATFTDDGPQTCARPFGADVKVRVASVSKMAVALAALKLAREGLLDLDRPASDYLGWPLVHPSYPESPITLRMLLSHRSSIRDPEEYWAAAPARFQEIFEKYTPFAASGDAAQDAPGAWFAYANLNYGVIAAVLEKATGQRFDILASDKVLGPLGIDAGFNWSGVSQKARRRAAAPHRLENGKWRAQIDAPAILRGSEPFFLAEPELDRRAYLASYTPGDNASLFGPQGGLRASADDLARLAGAMGAYSEAAADPWIFDPARPNGDPLDGLIRAYGLGVQIVDGAPVPDGASLIGHAGDAYGLYSGAWRVHSENAAGPTVTIGYVITGASLSPPPTSSNPAFNVAEEALLLIGLEAATIAAEEVATHAEDDEPRPYDPKADARADVDAALSRAGREGKRALIVLGANWCHDSRGLAANNLRPEIADLIGSRYALVYVDVGQRDRNLDIAQRFGVERLIGTPTIVIADPDGKVVNAATVHDWRSAASRSSAEWIDYLKEYAAPPRR